MKRILFCISCTLFSLTSNAQIFNAKDCIMDLSAGVGTIKDRGATFDQHFSMDWGIATIGDIVTVGLGFSVNNYYGATISGIVTGSYDYYYTIRTHYSNNVMGTGTTTQQKHRNADCYADAKISQEDVNAQFVASFHYSPIDKLDVYVKIGAGISCLNSIVSNIHNEQNLQKADHDNTTPSGTRTTYSYNDYEHVKWNGYGTTIGLAMSGYAGASWWFTEKWGATAKIGMISSNIILKSGSGVSCSIFAVGIAHKF